MSTTTAQATQVYQLFIKASPERIWDGITKSEFTQKYFHGSSVSWEDGRRRSLSPTGEVWTDEAVLEWNPPRRLVHGWRSLYDPEMALEDESRVTWEIEDQGNGVSLLTVTHDHLENAPKTAASVGGVGWMGVLSGLKTLLETGEPLNS